MYYCVQLGWTVMERGQNEESKNNMDQIPRARLGWKKRDIQEAGHVTDRHLAQWLGTCLAFLSPWVDPQHNEYAQSSR